MEDDKKVAVTEEVTENVQQEPELPNKEVKVDPIDSPIEEGEDQFIEEPEAGTEPPIIEQAKDHSASASTIEESTTEPTHISTDTNSEASIFEDIPEENIDEPVAEEAEPSVDVQNETDREEIKTEETELQPDEIPVDQSIGDQPDIEPSAAPRKFEHLTEDAKAKEPVAIIKENHFTEKEIEAIDLDTMSKVEQLDLLKSILDEADIRKIENLFKDLGTHYQTVFDANRKVALETFLKAEGSDEADFEFKGDDTDQEFRSLYEKLRRKRAQFYQELGKEKDDNLKRKNEILILLRKIIDGENQESFDRVKSLQQEWKNVGPVPGAQNHTLWASYHALMDRFYGHRSIYFELKELDRKKNLSAKLELCKKAEMLDASTDLRSAIAYLNELHEEFKHIGPVPREDQEALWQRFKAASDQVYQKRNEFHENQKVEFTANLEKKLALVEDVKALAVFDSDRIKNWNNKTKELLELQKRWESVGGMPRRSTKDVNKVFWGSFKKFFANKSRFFKKLDGERDENLVKKKKLLQKALEIREAEDWEATANAMKALQIQWKEIGIVPDKYRKSLYEEFNEHCNYFFERKRGQNAEQNLEFEKNLEKKKEILAKLQDMASVEGFNLEQVFVLLDEFYTTGFVPRNSVGKTLERYDKVCDKLLKIDSLSKIEIGELKSHIQVSKLKNSPNSGRKINRKEGLLKRRISGMENDIYNWKRNIDFFGRSKNSEQMKSEFQNRISDAEKELDAMKKELRLLNS